MSTYHKVPNENIDIDVDGKEVNILYNEDFWGNNYLTLSLKQIKDILADLEEEK